MFAAEWFIPISCMGPKHAPKDRRFDFSTNLYASEHVHVVPPWIMHINSLKTHLMHKNVQTNPEKSQKNNTTLLLFYVDTIKKLKAIRGNGYHFAPKVGAFPTETIMLVVRSSGLWEAYTQTCPEWEKNYHSMLMPLRDSMPSFMNFRRVLDLLEFKNKVSQCLRPSDDRTVLDIHSRFLHGT